MQATVELSFYPLHQDYSKIVTDFILELRKNENLRFETNGLSTQIFGEYDAVMGLLTSEMKSILEEQKAVFVMKIASGERSVANLPERLK